MALVRAKTDEMILSYYLILDAYIKVIRGICSRKVVSLITDFASN